MSKKYIAIQKICEWCRSHPKRDTFYYYEVGCHQRTLASLCDSPYRDRTWLTRRGTSEKRDATHGLMMYSIVSVAGVK